jgi:hypothetical protein
VDALRLDAFVQALTKGSSRRGLLRGITATALALTVTPFPGEGEAKQGHHRRKKKRKKRKKDHRERNVTSPLASPQDPVTTADAACSAVATAGLIGTRRVAQTFRALRSGQLTSASFVLLENPEGPAFDVEIRDVDSAGAPVSGFLARSSVINVPATDRNGRPLTVTAVFASPATVEAGRRYALVVTETSGTGFTVQINFATNPCADGNLFTDSIAAGNFISVVNNDLVFATTVKA